MTLATVDHIALQVENIARAVSWYQQHFKCEVSYQDETWAMLKFANINMALVVSRQHPPHIAFTCANPAAYGEAKQHRDGSVSSYMQDPEGNSVEMICYSVE